LILSEKKKEGLLALGFNEFSGYFAVAVVGFVTGYLAAIYGLKPYPFYLGVLFATAGFLISWLIVKDTKKFTLLEIENHDSLVSENKDKDATKGDLSFSLYLFKHLGRTAPYWPLVKQD
jgi:hypothetical protein